ncbi:MAG: cysteine hydrolase [Nitrospirota bacterium]
MTRDRSRSYMRSGMIILLAIFTLPVLLSASSAQTVIDAWDTVKVPPAPELKPVTADPKTTALLLLDFNKQTCNAERRPRCIATIPNVKKLLAEARAKGVAVIYSLSAGAVVTDVAQELAAVPGDPVVISGPDKFLGTDLEKLLKERNIATVIVAGTAAHGAVLYTASGAALRGMRVIVPADGISAETLYPEQYVVWNLANAPRVSVQTTLSRTDLIRF